MKKSYLVLSLIIIFAFLVRIIYINQFPPSLNWDEVSLGYNAYSILKTGKDEWGNFLPLIFRAYGDYKLPLYVYLTTPFVALFGLNFLSVKLVSILTGTFLPLIIFKVAKKFFPKNNIIPFISAILLAFSPSTIFLSRIALEANLFLFIFFLSIYFLLDKKYSISSIFYTLSLFSYNSSRVLLPFYLFILVYQIIKNKYSIKLNWPKFIPFLLMLFLLSTQMLSSSGQARYQWVSLLDQGSINKINELRQQYPRVIVNKITFFIFYAAKNYLSFFNPKYLFFQGGTNFQFNIPNFPLFSSLLLPLFLAGLIKLFLSVKNNKNLFIIIFWLLASPVPSAITRDAPHILRGIILLPIVVIIISIGFDLFVQKFKKISYLYLILSIVSINIMFWPKYNQYSKQYSNSWQYGYQQAVDYLKDNYSNYDQIIFTKKYGESHEFILFYWPWNPVSYQNNPNLNRDFHANWYWVNAFDKFKFINDWEIKDQTKNITTQTLLITSPNNYNQDKSNLLKTIYFLDGQPAFDILSIDE